MSKLYVIECNGGGEEFYKVGITRKPISERFNRGSMPYKYKILYLIEGTAGLVWDLETQIHRLLKNYRCLPKVDFGGSKTECFSSIPVGVSKLISKISSNNQMQLLTTNSHILLTVNIYLNTSIHYIFTHPMKMIS